MGAGDLNRRVRIDRRAGQGTLTDPHTWVPLTTVWGNVRMLTGKESILSNAIVGTATASIRIWYRTDLATGMRAVVDEVTFDILQALPNVASRKFTDLVCRTESTHA